MATRVLHLRLRTNPTYTWCGRLITATVFITMNPEHMTCRACQRTWQRVSHPRPSRQLRRALNRF